jgi:hypothetical protein
MYRLRHQGEKNQRVRNNGSSNYQLQHAAKEYSVAVTVNVVPSSLILFTLMMEAIRSSETMALIRVTRRHIPEDDILLKQINSRHFQVFSSS